MTNVATMKQHTSHKTSSKTIFLVDDVNIPPFYGKGIFILDLLQFTTSFTRIF